MRKTFTHNYTILILKCPQKILEIMKIKKKFCFFLAEFAVKTA